MSTGESGTRSVKIASDERTGWSSDRPRGGDDRPPRPVDVSTRCRLLTVADRMRYSPGSLVVVVSASAVDRDRFVERVFEEQGAVLGLDKVRALVAGRVPDDQLEERAAALLEAAVLKRLEGGQAVVVPTVGIEATERDRYVRVAHSFRRPRHIILLEAARDKVADEDALVLNELRRTIDTGEIGNEGFQTALRLGGATIDELKRVVFRPAPRDDA